MALQVFKVSSLSDVDNGRLARAIELQVRRVIDDCRDRAGLKTARKVAIEFMFSPIADETGDLMSAAFNYRIATTIPPQQREGLSFDVQKNGALLFSVFAPDNASQRTIFDGQLREVQEFDEPEGTDGKSLAAGE